LRSRVRPEEALLAGYGVALLAIMATTGHWTFTSTMHMRFVDVFLVLALGILARDFLRARREHRSPWQSLRRALPPAAQVVRDFVPFLIALVFYETLHDLTPLIRHDVVDAALIAIDRKLLGVDAAVWMGHLGSPWLTRVMIFCYLSYFFAPAILASLIYWADRRQLFRDFLVSLCVTTLLGYTGYLLVPAVQSPARRRPARGGVGDSDHRFAQGLRARLLPVAAHGAHDGGAGVRVALLAAGVRGVPADRARPVHLDDLSAHALRDRRRRRICRRCARRRHRAAARALVVPPGARYAARMTLQERFADAQTRVKSLTQAPSTAELLELYALYKQGSVGEVDGKRPGMLDIKGRAKWDAWNGKKGLGREQAMEAYVALVDRLVGKK
jgi:acyl-CoA-binding protein